MTKQLDLFYDYLRMPREAPAPSVKQLEEELARYKEALLARETLQKPYYERIQCCG